MSGIQVKNTNLEFDEVFLYLGCQNSRLTLSRRVCGTRYIWNLDTTIRFYYLNPFLCQSLPFLLISFTVLIGGPTFLSLLIITKGLMGHNWLKGWINPSWCPLWRPLIIHLRKAQRSHWGKKSNPLSQWRSSLEIWNQKRILSCRGAI